MEIAQFWGLGLQNRIIIYHIYFLIGDQCHNVTFLYFLHQYVSDVFVLRQKVGAVRRNGIFMSSVF